MLHIVDEIESIYIMISAILSEMNEWKYGWSLLLLFAWVFSIYIFTNRQKKAEEYMLMENCIAKALISMRFSRVFDV